MTRILRFPLSLLFWLTLTLSLAVLFARAGQKNSDLDQAFEDFRTSAKRLEKAISKAADENTQELRKDLNSSLSHVLKDVSRSMKNAADKLEGTLKTKKKSDTSEE